MSTSSPVLEMVKQLLAQLPGAFADATVKAFQMIWAAFMQLLMAHWGSVLVILVFILIYAVAVFLTTERWALLGSVLYNYLYWGAVFALGLIFGPELYAEDFFEVIAIVLWAICYSAVGYFLYKTGARKKW